jgi:hypothetical protein
MSTRAVYSFLGDNEAPRHVYKHSDGYPTGAVEWIEAALDHAWRLPRNENDEFAAAFVAANKSYYKNELFDLYAKAKKTKADHENIKRYEGYHRDMRGGQIRLIVQSAPMIPAMEAAANFAADAEYRYEVRCIDGELHVKAFATKFWDKPTEEEIYSGPLTKMRAWAEEYEKKDAVNSTYT